jgi:hypothetical protein
VVLVAGRIISREDERGGERFRYFLMEEEQQEEGAEARSRPPGLVERWVDEFVAWRG